MGAPEAILLRLCGYSPLLNSAKSAVGAGLRSKDLPRGLCFGIDRDQEDDFPTV